MAGDTQADIFDGLVVSAGAAKTRHYVEAERVTRITLRRVETDLSADEAAGLPPYEQPVAVTWHADRQGGFGARVRSALQALFGRR